MTEKRVIMDKKKLNPKESEGRSAKLKRNEMRNQSKKLKQKMKKRLIIRNLSFKVDEEKLKEVFSEFGEVVEAKIPLKADGKKRGFAFIQYKDTKSQIKAMKAMNFKEIYGRPIAVDFAVSKNAYQIKNQTHSNSQKMDAESIEANSNSESEDNEKEDVKQKIKEESDSDDSTDDDNNEADENDEDKKVRTFLKEFDADEEHVNSADESSSSDSSEDEDESNDVEKDSQFSDDIATASDKLPKKKHSNDVSEGKTVFIRNVSFSSTEENLHGLMEEYGETQYCLLCMDSFTDRPKGTAFVKFKEKESADKFIEESSKDPGILLDGRRLLCTYALSREELLKTKNESPKVTDKRNLRLLKCSVIIPGSKEAEGVSHADMAKRAKLEIVKKQKLKNTNFFVSDKRLMIHNIPKDITNKDLATLCKKSVGKGAVIKESRVMRDFKKTDAKGNPVSRGFGFVSFAEHEHALKALMELNNNPKIFTSQARPIVEFSVENQVALQSQQRRKEKIMMQNKKKIEKNQAGIEDQTEDNNQMSSPQKVTKRKGKGKNKHKNKKMKQNDVNTSCDKIQTAKSPKQKQKQKKQRRNKNKQGIILNSQDKKTLSVLKNKYKKTLLNK